MGTAYKKTVAKPLAVGAKIVVRNPVKHLATIA
jgi:hypothetical protein